MVFSKHSAGLSFQCAIALTPLIDMLAIIGEFLSCSMDAGFVLALPLHHGDLGSVGVSIKDHVAILVAWPCIVLLLKVNICKQYLPLRRRAAVHATLRNINDCALYFLVSAVS